MRRLPVVAIGVAALCALATAAEARAERMRLGAHDDYRPYSEGDWESAAPRPPRRSARAGKRRTATAKPGRRQVVRSVRSSRPNRMVRATAMGPMSMAARGFIDFARGGVSRSCLTPAARSLLERIEVQFGHVGIISTCRPGAVIAGSGRPSRHASGNAIDFNAPAGRKSEVVRWLIANHRAGGVMTYSDMNHIHVDIGHHFVALGAASGGSRRWR
jgi:Peptidase M15